MRQEFTKPNWAVPCAWSPPSCACQCRLSNRYMLVVHSGEHWQYVWKVVRQAHSCRGAYSSPVGLFRSKGRQPHLCDIFRLWTTCMHLYWKVLECISDLGSDTSARWSPSAVRSLYLKPGFYSSLPSILGSTIPSWLQQSWHTAPTIEYGCHLRCGA